MGFTIKIIYYNNECKTMEFKDNSLRAYDIKINEKIKKLVFIPLSNWGESNKTNIFSFDFRD